MPHTRDVAHGPESEAARRLTCQDRTQSFGDGSPASNWELAPHQRPGSRPVDTEGHPGFLHPQALLQSENVARGPFVQGGGQGSRGLSQRSAASKGVLKTQNRPFRMFFLFISRMGWIKTSVKEGFSSESEYTRSCAVRVPFELFVHLVG